MLTKKCSKCGIIKPVTEFYKSKNILHAWCKLCCSKYYKKQYLKNDKRKLASRHYYSTLHGKYTHYKKESVRRKINFKLTELEFAVIVSQPCYYCGELQENFNGVDRVNNKKGYIKGNCAPCCKVCNIMKHAQIKDEFIMKCKKIVEKQRVMK